jgi:cation:H+ antiporter
VDILILVGALLLILLGAELFTNGIEWFGHKLNLAEGAVGSVLAGVATATPETLIPVIAIIGPIFAGTSSSSSSSSDIGVGAILGAPFMLATLAMFVTGAAVVLFARGGRREVTMDANIRLLTRDMAFFVAAYAVAIATAFLPSGLTPVKWLVAIGLVMTYGAYVRAHFTDDAEPSDPAELNQLHATRVGLGRSGARLEIDILRAGDRAPNVHVAPRLRIISAQVVVALALIIIGAQAFVGAVEHLAELVRIDPKILALIIAPVATELPEQSNSVLWVRKGKDTLAMGNITGAMVFQSCLPTVLGIVFTEWAFSAASALAFASAGIAFVAVLLIFGLARRRNRLSGWMLLLGGPLYLGYVIAALLLTNVL